MSLSPAIESDLRLHLGRQTDRRIGLFDVLKHELSETAANEFLDELIADDTIVLFDAIYSEHLLRISGLIDSRVTDRSVFSVGSSAIETALVDHWREQGALDQPTQGRASLASVLLPCASKPKCLM